jgi:ABC-type multidrug transport system fused ATPase/permease subunit
MSFILLTSIIRSRPVFDILDRKPPPPGIGSMQVRSREGTSPLTNDGPLSIRLENVTFSYPARSQELILNGINLDIEAGKTLALVGECRASCHSFCLSRDEIRWLTLLVGWVLGFY